MLALAIYIIYTKINENDFIAIPIKVNALFLLLFISIFNWHFEILKWKILVNTFTKIDYYTAFSQSLAAHTAAITTPNKIGEYGAKALFFKNTFRKKILGLTFLGNSFQLMMTLFFGVFGLYIYLQTNQALPFNTTSILVLSLIITIALYYYLYSTFKLKKIKSFLNNVSAKKLKQIGFYSLLRYLLFSFQYYFFLRLFDVNASYIDLFPLIWLMYFVSSCIPSFSLADFVIKGSVALYLFSKIGIPENIILTTAFFMWILNFALPAVVGGFYIARFKTENQLGYDTN